MRLRLAIMAASSFAFACLIAYSPMDCLEGIGGIIKVGYNLAKFVRSDSNSEYLW